MQFPACCLIATYSKYETQTFFWQWWKKARGVEDEFIRFFFFCLLTRKLWILLFIGSTVFFLYTKSGQHTRAITIQHVDCVLFSHVIRFEELIKIIYAYNRCGHLIITTLTCWWTSVRDQEEWNIPLTMLLLYTLLLTWLQGESEATLNLSRPSTSDTHLLPSLQSTILITLSFGESHRATWGQRDSSFLPWAIWGWWDVPWLHRPERCCTGPGGDKRLSGYCTRYSSGGLQRGPRCTNAQPKHTPPVGKPGYCDGLSPEIRICSVHGQRWTDSRTVSPLGLERGQ